VGGAVGEGGEVREDGVLLVFEGLVLGFQGWGVG